MLNYIAGVFIRGKGFSIRRKLTHAQDFSILCRGFQSHIFPLCVRYRPVVWRDTLQRRLRYNLLGPNGMFLANDI